MLAKLYARIASKLAPTGIAFALLKGQANQGIDRHNRTLPIRLMATNHITSPTTGSKAITRL